MDFSTIEITLKKVREIDVDFSTIEITSKKVRENNLDFLTIEITSKKYVESTWKFVEIWSLTYRRNSQVESTSIRRGVPVGFASAFEHVWRDLEFSNLLFHLKHHPTSLERLLNYLKCFATMSLWQSNDLSTMLSQEFPDVVSSLTLLEGSCLFREYLKFIQFKSCFKSASHYFYCFNCFTDNLLKSVTLVMCQMSIWLNLLCMCYYFNLSTNMLNAPSWH